LDSGRVDRSSFLEGLGRSATPAPPTPPRPESTSPRVPIAPLPPAALVMPPPATPPPLPTPGIASDPKVNALFVVDRPDASSTREILWTWGEIRQFALVGLLLSLLAFGLYQQASTPMDRKPPTALSLAVDVPIGPRSWQDLPVETPKPTGAAAVNVRSTPAGARVLIDASDVGTTPLAMTSTPSGETLHVRLELEGHEPWEGEVARGQQGDFTLEVEMPER